MLVGPILFLGHKETGPFLLFFILLVIHEKSTYEDIFIGA